MINQGGGWQKSFMAPFSYMVRDRTYMVDQTEPEAGEPDHWPEHFGSEEGDNIRQRPKRAARSKHTNMMGVVPSKMLSEHPLQSTWRRTEKWNLILEPCCYLRLTCNIYTLFHASSPQPG